MSRARIGLSVSEGKVSAVAMRGRTIVWSDSLDVAQSDALANAVSELLGRWPGSKGSRVAASLDTPVARVKQLHGLAHVSRADLVFRAVRENPDRFFLASGGGTAVSSVARAGSDWYAAAFSADVLGSIAQGCDAAGASLDLTVPAQRALPAALANGALHGLPKGYESYAEAFAAGWYATHAPLALPSEASVARRARRHTALRATLIAWAGAAAIAALAAPTIGAELRRRELTAALAAERDSLRPVATAMSELLRTSSALNEIERFRASRTSSLRLLELLATRLPESTAVLSIRTDTVNATLVMLTRAGPGVLQSLADVDMLSNPQILGAFSREEVNGLPFERVAIRARLAHARPRERGPPQ